MSGKNVGNWISAPINFLKYYTLEREELTEVFTGLS